MKNKRIIGIDPGANGGLAVMGESGVLTFSYKKENGFSDVLREIKAQAEIEGEEVKAFVEYLTGVNGGKYQLTGRQGFVMGTSYGKIIGALEALEIPFELVKPQKWESIYAGIASKRGMDKKRALCSVAKQMFPAAKATMQTCDAILIAEWGRRQ